MKMAFDPATLPVAVLSLDLEDTSPENLMRVLAAVPEGCRLLVVPFGFPRAKSAAVAERFLARLARTRRCVVIGGFRKGSANVAAVFSKTGRCLGSYRQTHALPGEKLNLGAILAPMATPLGKIGITLGSDLYFPETHWSLAQQGAEILVHLEAARVCPDHWHSVLVPKVRAFDCHVPMLIARPSSRLLKITHNFEFQIPGTPMAGSTVIDQNGAILAATGYSQGVACAQLRAEQHCRSIEKASNLRISSGLDVWKLYFNDSRAKYFKPLRRHYRVPAKPHYRKRRIRIAMPTHTFTHQIGKKDGILPALMRQACAARPDIIVWTEMEGECRPDARGAGSLLRKLVRMAADAGSWLLIGGVRADKPGTPQHRRSHAWLWDRKGNRVFESAIMLYGYGCGLGVFDTDFGRIGIRLCGDVYAPEFDRLFALRGVDAVFNPSMSWGASGLINTELGQARALDNGHYILNAHLSFSDPGLRSEVIDPMGRVIAASAYADSSVLVADLDLDSKRGVPVPAGKGKDSREAYLAGYRSPMKFRLVSQRELLRLRRPELYTGLDADRADHPFTTRDRGDGVILRRR